ncbi:PAAR domain-containing protein [Ornithinimicrobium tianjinense]|uniref:Zn-binding Pro-Ala-Ala-Arg (PAAR) domain-containing protein, incolved in TypeVI secretion n=1 Tax=Ornithinimicrobium tianjinense TaxID=1195761 RepID=A0A917BIF2_9MICO|nr:PAAR domain-containing protein [Ornithinimicrobium tianjinense]GGF40646.1 hypothetical protein GCM10011366_05370 [Ornithinimicrobium tianjinense]
MPSVARVGDTTSHGGVVVGPGVSTVLVGGLPAATVGDVVLCPGLAHPALPGPQPVVRGSATVLVGGRPVARTGDPLACGAVVVRGVPTVLVGC